MLVLVAIIDKESLPLSLSIIAEIYSQYIAVNNKSFGHLSWS